MNSVNSVFSGISNVQGTESLQSAKSNSKMNEFTDLVKQLKSVKNEKRAVGKNISSDQISENGKLKGDVTADLYKSSSNPADKYSKPRGAAAGSIRAKGKTIDRTSKLYEKSLELESYMVKMMLSSMRKTVNKTEQGGYGQKIYEDMMYDQYAASMSKNAGFGLADEIYLELAH